MQLDEVGREAEKRMVDEELPRAVSALKHITNFDGAVFGALQPRPCTVRKA